MVTPLHLRKVYHLARCTDAIKARRMVQLGEGELMSRLAAIFPHLQWHASVTHYTTAPAPFSVLIFVHYCTYVVLYSTTYARIYMKTKMNYIYFSEAHSRKLSLLFN